MCKAGDLPGGRAVAMLVANAAFPDTKPGDGRHAPWPSPSAKHPRPAALAQQHSKDTVSPSPQHLPGQLPPRQ